MLSPKPSGAKSFPISVIIPCYCSSCTIFRAVESVAAQTVRPVELILVEDASPDNGKSLDSANLIASAFSEFFRVQVIALETNCGCANARNVGWEVATQQYVAFLDADDVWHPKKIELQYSHMIENREVVLSGHGYRRLSNRISFYDWPLVATNIETITKSNLLMHNRFVTPSVMVKRDIPFRFDDGKRHMEDHLLWLRIVCAGYTVTKLNLDLAAIFKAPFGDSGLSSQLLKMEMAELENYWVLFRSGDINIFIWIFAVGYSLTKFLRRIFLVFLRRLSFAFK